MSSSEGLERRITSALDHLNEAGAYRLSLVCTDQGLLVAHSGGHVPSERLAGITSLFDDIVVRAGRDLELGRVDEVTLLDPEGDRLVVRPIPTPASATRFFLVLLIHPRATWRQNTNRVVRLLVDLLKPLVQESP